MIVRRHSVMLSATAFFCLATTGLLRAQINSLGACCQSQGICDLVIEEECQSLAGEFRGHGTLCEESCPGRVGTAFTYSGQLKHNGLPYSGPFQVEFALWDLPIAGQLLAGPQTTNSVADGGLFQTNVDFGEGSFGAGAPWLEVSVCIENCDGSNAFTVLSPRQLITPVPFALQTRGLVVDAEGNLGIGLDTPSNRLSVAGHAHVLGNVGIGTDTPTAMLHLARPLADTSIRFQSARYVQPQSSSANGSPTLASTTGDGVPWNEPTAAIGSNDSRAEVALTGTAGGVDAQNSQSLDLTNFGFTLPADAQVVGFQVAVEARGTSSCPDCDAFVVSLYTKLLGQTEIPHLSTDGLPQNDAIITSGGPSSTGGVDWTAAQVNSSSFGVRLQAQLSLSQLEFCYPYPLPCVYGPCDCAGSATIGVDSVAVTVYYYDAPTETSPLNWSMGLSQTTSNLHIAKTPDLTSPVVTVTPTGVGIGVTNPTYGLELPNSSQLIAYGRAKGWFTYSSKRWKENIERIPDALTKLVALEGVMFNWLPDHGGQRDIGFVAEDVAKVVPELVGMEPDGQFAGGMKYDRVTALAVEAIKELNARFVKRQQELQSDLAEKEAQIRDLERRLERLESATTESSRPPERD